MEKTISKTPMITADYFSEEGLIKQVGLNKGWWNQIILKELIDNALDAIEPLKKKEIHIEINTERLGIYDNGSGIKKDIVKSIYDFNNYVSQNRNYITASRGKQGNGLKTIISICYLNKYRLLWHTAEGIVMEGIINPEQLRYGKVDVNFKELGKTEKRGIEIIGFDKNDVSFCYYFFCDFVECNPDVSFYLNYMGETIEHISQSEAVDKSQNISIAYYDYDSYQNFIINTQDGNTTYKKFLENVFGTRIKNKSTIKSKIKDIDFNSDEFISDFLMLREDQATKKYTLLKKQLIGLENGRYAITARQIWYKMREISGIEEKKNTYTDFTQNILTEWIDDNPEFEDKVNFSDRGNFYVNGSQNGLGTANVRNFLNEIGTAQNVFKCYGGINSNIHIEPDFDLKYKYDKVLYIEKTGFDAIFKAEKIGEKYNMIIVSGQGFSTRAAKTLLYQFQQMGMKLYCLHDLDISGIYILESFATPNKKFKNTIYMENLGVTFADIQKYNIVPEIVEKKKEDIAKLENLPSEYKEFFDTGTSFRRVELNAFTTAQILEIIDNKLSNVNNLPTINLEETLSIDHNAIKETAFMRLVSEKYKKQLSDIYVPIDLSEYTAKYTVKAAKNEIPELEEHLIQQYQEVIANKLNIS